MPGFVYQHKNSPAFVFCLNKPPQTIVCFANVNGYLSGVEEEENGLFILNKLLVIKSQKSQR